MLQKSRRNDLVRVARGLEILRPPLPKQSLKEYPSDGPLVVLLHGLWRSESAMAPLARRLSRQGFHVLNIPYASFRWELNEILDYLHREIEKRREGRPVHFVTHSLGGILSRHLIETGAVDNAEKILMLAPPNQGSAIIEMLDRGPLIRVLGPMGRKLHPERLLEALPNRAPEGVETRVLAGTRARIPFFQKQLDGPNDGIVSVAETRLPGAERDLIATDHTFITADPRVLAETEKFLRGEK